MSRKQRAVSSDHNILSGIEKDARRDVLVHHNLGVFRASERATWEVKTTETIERNTTSQKFQALKNQDDAALDERRSKLRQLLYEEEEEIMFAIHELRGTPTDRADELRKKAEALREEQEVKRIEFVDKMLYKQWRESCDPMRAKDSHAFLNAVVQKRFDQGKEKEAHKKFLAEEDARFAKLWNEDRLRKEKRHADELAQLEMSKREFRADIQRQIEAKKILHGETMAESKAMDEVLLAKWKADQVAEKEELIRRRAKAKAASVDAVLYNNEERRKRDEISLQEKFKDIELLRFAMDREEAEDEKERNEKQRQQTETRLYRSHLSEQMVKEEEDNSARDAEIERFRLITEEKQNAIWAAEAAARQALLDEVVANRNQKLLEKASGIARSKENAALDKKIQEDLFNEQVKKDMEGSDAAAKAAMENRIFVQQQMQAKSLHRGISKQINDFQDKNSKVLEASFSKRVEEEPIRVGRYGRA